VTVERRAEANEIAAAKLVERPQQMMLIGQPALIFANDDRAIPVPPDPERIAPFAASTDIDVYGRGGFGASPLSATFRQSNWYYRTRQPVGP
jgi:hypothetical protein